MAGGSGGKKAGEKSKGRQDAQKDARSEWDKFREHAIAQLKADMGKKGSVKPLVILGGGFREPKEGFASDKDIATAVAGAAISMQTNGFDCVLNGGFDIQETVSKAFDGNERIHVYHLKALYETYLKQHPSDFGMTKKEATADNAMFQEKVLFAQREVGPKLFAEYGKVFWLLASGPGAIAEARDARKCGKTVYTRAELVKLSGARLDLDPAGELEPDSQPQAAAAGAAKPAVPLGAREDFADICARTGILCSASGMVNVVAILHAGMTVAHHTGNTSHFGRLLGSDAARFGLLMLAFLLGSLVPGATAANMDAHFAGGRSIELVVSAIAVAVGALVASTSTYALTAVTLFAFSQGLQNGVTSQFSAMPLRTTHTTGTLTDIGIFLGQCARAALNGQPMPPLRKPMILALSIGSFGLGGLLSKLIFSVIGAGTAFVPAAMVAAAGMYPPNSFGRKEKTQ